MTDLMTLADIAEMNHCSIRHARDVLVKLPGFPEEAPTSTPRIRLWLRTEVRAFQPNIRPLIAAMKKAAADAFVKKSDEIDLRIAATRRHHGAKRRTAKMQRTPAWADLAAIRAVYEEAARLENATGDEYHVDHAIPLQGKLVSGLHVANNLQILPAIDNYRKRNRFEVSP